MNAISTIVSQQRTYFQTGATLPVSFRIQALKRLKQSVQHYESELLTAIHTDLGKSANEAYMCEVGLLLSDISFTLRHIRKWARPTRKRTPLTNFPACSYICHDPYGVVLIMSPWNYPCLLTLQPLVGAIAGGNTAVVKPSAYSPATSEVIARIISETFAPEYVAAVTGGRAENQTLLDQQFDYIFFTGGVKVGHTVMEKAAHYLTPVTLELGGKSPVIIDESACLRVAARRVAFGKFLNCGQTCIAPDYVLCHRAVHDAFVECLKEETAALFGSQPLSNPDYGHIINSKHFERLCGLTDASKVVYGGAQRAETLQIEPTIMDGVSAEDAIMGEEIFGPILPILVVENMDEAFAFIASRPHPLALYIFSQTKAVQQRFITGLQFGGGCVNDTISHIASHNMPFGGVGASGMGHYHGKYSFDTFTHNKTVVKRCLFPDVPLRYPPYSSLQMNILRRVMR